MLSRPPDFPEKEPLEALIAAHPQFDGVCAVIEGVDLLVYLQRYAAGSTPRTRRLVAVGGKRYRREHALSELSGDLSRPDFLMRVA